MKKYIQSVGLFFVAFVLAGTFAVTAYADDDNRGAGEVAGENPEIPLLKNPESSSLLKQARESAKEAQERFKEEKNRLREEAEERIKSEQEKYRELRKQLEERYKEEREDLKDRVSEIKDAKKRELANGIIKQLDNINERWTNHFVNYLNHLQNVLAKIILRTDKAAANGSDVAAVRTAIQNASSSIAAARTAVEAQAKKVYSVTVTTSTVATSTTSTSATTTEVILRSAFKTVKEQLRKDLTALRDGAIRNAREAVKATLKALKAVPHVDDDDDDDNATTTPATTTPSTTTPATTTTSTASST